MDESDGSKIYLSTSLFGSNKKPQIALSPVRLRKIQVGKTSVNDGSFSGKKSSSYEGVSWSVCKKQTVEPMRSVLYSRSHSKKVLKQALRQQAKRRRKNTKIAACNSAAVRRHLPQNTGAQEEEPNNDTKGPSMVELLSSIPGVSMKRKRSSRKLSTAAQLEQTKEGCIDLETPDSILVQTNLRDLLNEQAFSSLPQLYQQKLAQLLPSIDRISVNTPTKCLYKLSPSALNNEFFKSACSEWRDRLAEGEFTSENQQKRKLETEREKNKLDPWKMKHFEPIWGDNVNMPLNITSITMKELSAPKLMTAKIAAKPPAAPVLRDRTVGAVTRSVSMYREKREAEGQRHDTSKKFKRGTPLGNNYLFGRSIPISTSHEKSSFDKPLELKPVEHLTESPFGHGEPLLKTVQLERNVEKALPSESVPCEDVASISGSPSAKENEAPKLESTPVDSSPKMAISEELKANLIRPAAAVECDLPAPRVVPADIENEISSMVAKSETLTSESESKTQSIEGGNETTVVEGEIKAQKVEAECKTQYEAENTSRILIPVSNTTVCDTVSEVRVSGTEFEAVEAENRMQIPQKNISNLSNNNEILGDQAREEFSSKEIVEETIARSSEENVFTEIQNENDPPGKIDAEENSDDNFVEGADEDASAVGEESLLESLNIERIIREEEEAQWETGKSDQMEANMLSAWAAVDSDSEKLLAEVNLSVADEPMTEESEPVEDMNTDEVAGDENVEEDADRNWNDVEDESATPAVGGLTELRSDDNIEKKISLPEQVHDDNLGATGRMVDEADGSPQTSEPEREETVSSNCENQIPEDRFNMDEFVEADRKTCQSQEQIQTELSEPSSNVINSNAEHLLAVSAPQTDNHVIYTPSEGFGIHPEANAPSVPTWNDYNRTSISVLSAEMDNSAGAPLNHSGQVNVELEVTVTPKVDVQVPTYGGGGPCASSSGLTLTHPTIAPSSVIPLTSIVGCPTGDTLRPILPSTPLVTSQSMPTGTYPRNPAAGSAPVRSVMMKTQVKSGGRGGRYSSNKLPPGAVNLERSYQICQAVIQNSPNRDQLKVQLKPPPSMLMGGYKEYPRTQSGRGGHAKSSTRAYNPPPAPNPMLIKHVFTSAPQGVPVTMAVLPPPSSELTKSQMGQYLLVQRSGLGNGVRRSSSAPPANQKGLVYSSAPGHGRPNSIGMQPPQLLPQLPQLQKPLPPPPPGLRPAVRSVLANPHPHAYYPVPVPQPYGLDDCSCSRKAMVICKKCGAFCHNDCIIEPFMMCVNCR